VRVAGGKLEASQGLEGKRGEEALALARVTHLTGGEVQTLQLWVRRRREGADEPASLHEASR